PSATLDKRHPDFCRLILPTISPNRQGRSMIRLSLSLGLRRLGRFRKFFLLMLFAALLPRLLALAFGLRGLGNRVRFLGIFCRHIAPPIHHHPPFFAGTFNTMVEVAIAVPTCQSRRFPPSGPAQP